MSTLPRDVLALIYNSLPHSDHMSMRLVCTDWNAAFFRCSRVRHPVVSSNAQRVCAFLDRCDLYIETLHMIVFHIRGLHRVLGRTTKYQTLILDVHPLGKKRFPVHLFETASRACKRLIVLHCPKNVQHQPLRDLTALTSLVLHSPKTGHVFDTGVLPKCIESLNLDMKFKQLVQSQPLLHLKTLHIGGGMERICIDVLSYPKLESLEVERSKVSFGPNPLVSLRGAWLDCMEEPLDSCPGLVHLCIGECRHECLEPASSTSTSVRGKTRTMWASWT